MAKAEEGADHMYHKEGYNYNPFCRTVCFKGDPAGGLQKLCSSRAVTQASFCCHDNLLVVELLARVRLLLALLRR